MATHTGVRETRRPFLRTAGVATRGRRRPEGAELPETKLTILEWVSFVPASDVEFKRLAAEFASHRDTLLNLATDSAQRPKEGPPA